jgi:uncharacterized protein (DUF2062 family)
MPEKSLKELWSALVRILKENGDSHGIALGVAIGAFIGITPLYGFHTILCLTAMFIIRRANKIAILLGTNVSIPPTIATITWTAYDIGRIVLAGRQYPPLSWEYLRNFKISRASELYFPLFVGSVVLALAVAVFLYLVTRAIAAYLRKRHAVKR